MSETTETKPKRRRRNTGTSLGAADETQKSTASTEATSEAKPKRRRRTTEKADTTAKTPAKSAEKPAAKKAPAKKAPAKKAAAKKSTAKPAAKKTEAKKATSKKPRVTVKSIVEPLIERNWKDEKIIEAVLKKIPDSSINKAHIACYRSRLKNR